MQNFDILCPYKNIRKPLPSSDMTCMINFFFTRAPWYRTSYIWAKNVQVTDLT